MQHSSVTIERKRIDCNALPKGWQREEVLRKSGITAGNIDVYYYSPTGKKIDSKPQLARFLGDTYDISSFDFQNGKIVQQPMPTPTVADFYRNAYAQAQSQLTHTVATGACVGGGSGASAGGGASASPTTPTSITPVSNSNTVNVPRRKYRTQIGCSNNNSNTNNKININNNNNNNIFGKNTISYNINQNNNVFAAPNQGAAQLRQQSDFRRSLRTDTSLVPPIRQTASIFKQPVTVVRNQKQTGNNNNYSNNNNISSLKQDANNSGKQLNNTLVQEKPQQLFWQKRLESMRACHASGEVFEDIVLPKTIRTIGPLINEQTVLQSLATALHVLNVPVTGQTSSKTEINKNATAYINAEQPLMQAVLVNEEDIRKQEERVNAARKKLQDALKPN